LDLVLFWSLRAHQPTEAEPSKPGQRYAGTMNRPHAQGNLLSWVVLGTSGNHAPEVEPSLGANQCWAHLLDCTT